MPTEVTVHAVHQGQMQIVGEVGGNTVQMDYPVSPDQELKGIMPLQLLLTSLAGCSGNSVAVLLKKMGQPITGLEVDVKAQRRDEHPTVFSKIDMNFTIKGTGLDTGAIEKVLEISEKQICPVWIMLAAGTPIEATYEVVEG